MYLSVTLASNRERLSLHSGGSTTPLWLVSSDMFGQEGAQPEQIATQLCNAKNYNERKCDTLETLNRIDCRLEVNMFPNLQGPEYEDNQPSQCAVESEVRSRMEQAIVKKSRQI